VGARLAEPQRVQALAGKKIVSCSCGDYFSACVSDTGVLYTWGEGTSGTFPTF
jgi:alpha-tubulin suppressor-like RCC1 family protein